MATPGFPSAFSISSWRYVCRSGCAAPRKCWRGIELTKQTLPFQKGPGQNNHGLTPEGDVMWNILLGITQQAVLPPGFLYGSSS